MRIPALIDLFGVTVKTAGNISLIASIRRAACCRIRMGRAAHAARPRASDLRVVTGAGPWCLPGTGPPEYQRTTVTFGSAVLATVTEQHEGSAAFAALTGLSTTLAVVDSLQQFSPQQTGQQQQQVSQQPQHALAAVAAFDFWGASAPTPITVARVNAPTTPSI